MSLISAEKKQALIGEIKGILKEYPSMTVNDLKNKDDEFSNNILMHLGECGYFVRDPHPYRNWDEVPLLEFLKSLQEK